MIKKILSIVIISVALFAQQNNDYNRFLLAQSYEQQGSFDKAQKIYEELYQKDPNNIQYFNSLNNNYIQQKNFAASILIIEERIKLFPGDISLIGQLGTSYHLMGNYEKAYQIWDEPLNKQTADQMTFRVIVNYAIERRAFEKAIEILQRGKEKTKDQFIFSLDLANLYSLTMRYSDAAKEYCDILEISPSQLPTVESRILSFISKPGAIDETLEIVEDRAQSNNSIKYVLARLYIEKKMYEKAFEIYLKLDETNQMQGGDLYNFGEYVFKEGEFEISGKVFNSVIERYPQSRIVQSTKLGFAKSQEALLRNKYFALSENWKNYSPPAKLKKESVEPAIKAFDEITQIYKHSEVAIESYLRLAQIYSKLLADNTKAKEYLNLVLQDYPTSRYAIDTKIELGEIYLFEGRIEEAEKSFSEAIELKNVSAEKKNQAAYNLARIKSFKGEFDPAKKYLSEILTNLKDDLANDAMEFSFLLNSSKNDSSNIVKFSEAEILAYRTSFEEAKNIYELIAQDPKALVFHSIVKLRAAEMEIALSNYDRAKLLLSEISEDSDKNIYADKALYLLGRIFEYGLNDKLEAISTYEKLLVKFPKSLYLDKARERILKLKEKIS